MTESPAPHTAITTTARSASSAWRISKLLNGIVALLVLLGAMAAIEFMINADTQHRFSLTTQLADVMPLPSPAIESTGETVPVIDANSSTQVVPAEPIVSAPMSAVTNSGPAPEVSNSLMAAFLDLRSAERSGQSFRQELDDLLLIAAHQPEALQEHIKQLAPFADHETPSRITLRAMLTTLEPEVEQAMNIHTAKTPLEHIEAELSALVTIRRTDVPAEQTILQNLDAAISAPDCHGLDPALEALSPSAQGKLHHWLDRAHERCALDAKLHSLKLEILQGSIP